MNANSLIVAIFLVSTSEKCGCGTISEEVMAVTSEYDHYTATFKYQDELYIGAKNQISKHSWLNLRKMASFSWKKPECPTASDFCNNYIDILQLSSKRKENQNQAILSCATQNTFEHKCLFLDLSLMNSDEVTLTSSTLQKPFFQMTTSYEDSAKIHYLAINDEKDGEKIIAVNLNEKYNLHTTSRQVNSSAEFIGGFWYNNRVYLLFNEGLAEEHSFNGIILKNGVRLAEVCTDDRGANNEFVSFQKSFLRCGQEGFTSFDNLVAFSPVYEFKNGNKAVSGLVTFSTNLTRNGAFCAFTFDNILRELNDDNEYYCWRDSETIETETNIDLAEQHKNCMFNSNAMYNEEARRCPIKRKIQCNEPYYYNFNRNISKLVAMKAGSSKYIFAMANNGMLEFHVYNDNRDGNGCLLDKFVIEENAVSSDVYHMHLILMPLSLIIGTKNKLIKIDGNAFCKVYEDEDSCISSGIEFCYWRLECLADNNFGLDSNFEIRRSKPKDCREMQSNWGPWSLPYSCSSSSKKPCLVSDVKSSDKCKADEYRCICVSRICLHTNGCSDINAESEFKEGDIQRIIKHCEPYSIPFGTESIQATKEGLSAYLLILISFSVTFALFTASLIAVCYCQSTNGKVNSGNTYSSRVSTLSSQNSRSGSVASKSSAVSNESTIDRRNAHYYYKR